MIWFYYRNGTQKKRKTKASERAVVLCASFLWLLGRSCLLLHLSLSFMLVENVLKVIFSLIIRLRSSQIIEAAKLGIEVRRITKCIA